METAFAMLVAQERRAHLPETTELPLPVLRALQPGTAHRTDPARTSGHSPLRRTTEGTRMSVVGHEAENTGVPGGCDFLIRSEKGERARLLRVRGLADRA